MTVMYGSFFCARIKKLANLIFVSRVILITALLVTLAACDKEDPLTDEIIVNNFAIAYLKRPTRSLVNPAQVAQTPEGLDVANNEGLIAGNVFIRDLSSPSAAETNITEALTAPILNGPQAKSAGDVAGLEVSYDGTKLLFALHAGVYEEEDINGVNTWNIYEYDLAAPEGTDPLRRIIGSGGFANEGDDYDPHYLPDGRIVFTSNRQKGHVRSNLDIGPLQDKTFDEARQQFAYNLHVMDANGDNGSIEQISYNLSSDLNPTVLQDGRILFTRWDRMGNNKFSLYTVYSDGTGMNPLYGVHSNTIQVQGVDQAVAFAEARPTFDGKLLSTYVPREGTQGTGEMVLIDYQNFTDTNVKKFGSTSSSTSGHESVTNNQIRLTQGVSQFGRYVTPYPIWEPNGGNRVLVSWSVCRLKPVDEPDDTPEELRNRQPCISSNLTDPEFEPAPPFYGIYIFDLNRNLKQPIVLPESEDYAIVNPVAILSRPVEEIPAVYIDKSVDDGNLDLDLQTRQLGAINIKSVYDTQGTLPLVDRPLEPHGVNVLTAAETANIPMTTVMMDTVTGAVDVDGSSPNPTVARQVADLAMLRDPARRTASQRPARFIRVIKGVVVYDPQVISGEQFGRTGGYRMREILGYKEIEPDGSVYMEVPANVPFAIQVLDSQGRALVAHDNWLQVIPGEIRVCNGCHSPNDKQQAINTGAPDATLFPNTVNTLPPEPGETMAEVRQRLDCLLGCDYPKLTMDIVYQDVWTDPTAAGRAADTAFAYSYRGAAQGLEDYDPTSELDDSLPLKPIMNSTFNPSECEAEWSWSGTRCRIIINYPDHIQPIWDRTLYMDDGVANGMDAIVGVRPCTNCHVDQVLNMGVLENQVPAGDLNLENVMDGNVNRLHSYEQLTATRTLLELDAMGNLVTRFQRDINGDLILDADGNPIPETKPPVVQTGVARSRTSPLIRKMTTPNAGDPFDHAGMLLPGELRVLIEWNDNGTQYYNDPLVAPMN